MQEFQTSNLFSKFATLIAEWSGRPATFVLAVILVLAWPVSDAFFGFSSQNRDGKALQAKLDELILTSQAQNKFVGIEKLDEKQLREMSRKIAEQAECADDVADQKTDEWKSARLSMGV